MGGSSGMHGRDEKFMKNFSQLTREEIILRHLTVMELREIGCILDSNGLR
jgi:hypothetical protein